MLKSHPTDQDDLKKTIFEKEPAVDGKEQPLKDIFAITEIKIEEISIDGICGVY